ncbi:xanthine dehydrogenase family protein molybdopterin-binding subunit [Chitinophaga japonensis]|uniref:Isoquinoline 1-oxidoreductase beta subunit n=1 Tax=Chitinophaga japonensis TaxID=104662 RepID=A0A562T5S4_CHIJA|nr:molybdopterin cofactor-binding domain-containing protein [Chitinophaga japonensis]TWI88604.1 isoquinoline 1-oxidoreductase beta subunit [Chitinophaga japonensis]
MNRRQFMRVMPLAGGGFMLSFYGLGKTPPAMQDTAPTAESAALGDFLSILPGGEVIFNVTRHEMGQGVSTALAMIIAEELCADFRQVSITYPDADPQKYTEAKGGHGTGGSSTVISMTPILRQAGATAREMLVQAAAAQWNTTPANCYAANHAVIHRKTGQQAGFGTLAAAAAKLPPPASAKLKNSKDFSIIGQPQPGKTLPLLVTGKLAYGMDASVPGMQYALVARCPVFKGKVGSYDAAKALAVKGVSKVVTTRAVAGLQGPVYPYDIREGVAIIASSYWAAKKGRDQLTVNWEEGPHAHASIAGFEAMAAQRGGQRIDPVGYTGEVNAIANIDHAKHSLRAGYVFPYMLHSLMEPLNCTAHFKGDSCELWTGTQWPEYITDEIHRIFGIPKEKVLIHLFPSGGGFGRRAFPDAAIEALCISREAGNIPVKVTWTREDDHQTNFAHCYQRLDYQAAWDDNGQLYAWYEKECRTYMWDRTYPATELTSIGYNIPNIRYDFEDLTSQSIIQSTAWRSVMSNGWALSECFVDEVAATLKKDPYAFRLSLLVEGREVNVGRAEKVSNTRLLKVLRLAKEKSDWDHPLPKGRGRGIAAYPYGNSYCAIIAEVTVQDNKVSVDKVICAVDCGMVVNPSGARNQVEGGVVWGLSALLYGGVDIRNGRVTGGNFNRHKVVRIHECPDIEVHFVEAQDEQPWGLGEISNPVTVPAVLNAIYAATGKRVRTLPVTLNHTDV